MNQKESDNLLLAIDKYKNVCISIGLFTEFLRNEPWFGLLEPVTDKEVLMSGLYGRVGNTKIWVSKIANNPELKAPAADEPYCIRVSNCENVTTRKNNKAEGWSPLLKLENFDRLNKLRAFW